MLAAARGHLECVALLCRYSANVHCCNRAGASAIYLARRKGHSLCAQLLTKASTRKRIAQLRAIMHPKHGATDTTFRFFQVSQ